MKVLVIPDVHGSPHWKKNVEENFDKVDKVVFLGDYYDSFNEEERGLTADTNLKEIIDLKKQNPEKVEILLGNHDLDNYLLYGKCSGFQMAMAPTYYQTLFDNLELFKIAVEIDGWVFSHAGFSIDWVKDTKFLLESRYKDSFNILEDPVTVVNNLLHNKYYKIFTYWEYDFSGYGDSNHQGPLWIRPPSLLSRSYFQKQVIGHTETTEEKPMFLKRRQAWKDDEVKWDYNYLLLLDSPSHAQCCILDTQKDLESYGFFEV